ncbi:DUF4235 domain-containing protein [Roseivirga sp. BDSF3-8]|uniref:DUF4235 domain-containing protein n=1 Tax=Roseivirga sp. BDSF3-8 TaxID=3241598 RepID=UPI003531A4B0
MNLFSSKNKWGLVSYAASVGSAVLVKKLIGKGWQVASGKKPPKNPVHYSVGWKEAILYMALTGAVAGVVRVFALRGASEGWKKLEGHRPPL